MQFRLIFTQLGGDTLKSQQNHFCTNFAQNVNFPGNGEISSKIFLARFVALCMYICGIGAESNK